MLRAVAAFGADGHLEHADRWRAVGWLAGGGPVAVLVDGRPVATVQADRHRPDLLAAGVAGGMAGFAHWFHPPLPEGRACRVSARAGDGGRALPGARALAPAPPPAHPWRPDDGPPLALAVDEAAPDMARDAGSAALLGHMAALRALGYAVRFTTLAELPAALAETAGRVRVAYLHRLPAALQAAAVRAASPGARVVFALADLAHLRDARQAAIEGRPASPGLRAAELAAAAAADATITHSPIEAALLRRALPGRRIHVAPWSPPRPPPPLPWAERSGIGFLGNYGHPPNPDAARMLLERVMPLVWRKAPIPCALAGHGMPPWLRAQAGPLVRALPALPDAAAFWRTIRVSAAPLRFGAGIKGKVLDSLAAGIPCVASPIAAEGIALPPALIAADAPAMAEALLRLHADEAENAATAAAAQAALASPAQVARALAWALARE